MFSVLHVHSTKVTNCLMSTFLLHINVSNIIGPVVMLVSEIARFILITLCKVSALCITHNIYCAPTYKCISSLYSPILISDIPTSCRGDMHITNFMNAIYETHTDTWI